MIYEVLSVEEGLKRAACRQFACVRNMSSMYLGRNTETPDPEQILEARFFDETQEVRLIRENGKLRACSFTCEPGDDYIDISGKTVSGFGSGFSKRNYLSYDEDGQCCITAVCLTGWEE